MMAYRVLVVLAAISTVVAASVVGPALLRAGWHFAVVASLCALTCSGVSVWAAYAIRRK